MYNLASQGVATSYPLSCVESYGILMFFHEKISLMDIFLFCVQRPEPMSTSQSPISFMAVIMAVIMCPPVDYSGRMLGLIIFIFRTA